MVPRSIVAMNQERERNINEFWRRFVAEYLPTIAARAKWHRKVLPLAIGDLVMIADSSVRTSWRRGIVEDVIIDPLTKQCRDLVVRTPDGSLYRRSAAKVAPIRVHVN